MTPGELRAHLDAAVSGRAGASDEPLTHVLARRCWPAASESDGGAARRWLVRWKPRRAEILPLACGCAQRRCAICN